MLKREKLGLSTQIYNDLKQKIELFEFKPGDRISETSLTEIYSVSRTPIKHSLSRLEADEIIEVRPQIGTFVSKIDTKHVHEFFTIRMLLELAIINDVKQKIDKVYLDKIYANLMKQFDLLDIEDADNIDLSKQFWKLDNDFHRLIFKSVDKEFIWDFILSQSSQFNRFRVLSASYNKESLCIKIADHKSIYDYISSDMNFDINSVYNDHLFTSLDVTIENLMSKYPEYFK